MSSKNKLHIYLSVLCTLWIIVPAGLIWIDDTIITRILLVIVLMAAGASWWITYKEWQTVSDTAYEKILKLADKLSHDDLRDCVDHLHQLHDAQEPQKSKWYQVVIKTEKRVYHTELAESGFKKARMVMANPTYTYSFPCKDEIITLRGSDIKVIVAKEKTCSED